MRDKIKLNSLAVELRRDWDLNPYSPIDLFSIVLAKLPDLTILFYPMSDNTSGMCIKNINGIDSNELKERENQGRCWFKTKTTLNLPSVLLTLKGVIPVPWKRNDACVNTCCLCFIFRLFHQRKESRAIWTSDLRPRLVFSGFPVYKGRFSIENQPAAQPDLSMATKPGHMSLVIGPQWLCIITPFEFPILLLFSPLKQGLGISREKEIQWCVKQRKNE